MKLFPLAGVAVVLGACAGGAKEAPDPAAPAVAKQDAPKTARHVISLRGSSTLGLAYAPKLVRAFLEKEGATNIKAHDEMKAKDEVWLSGELGGETLWIEINTPGTKFGFESLAKGFTDIVLASRPIKESEASKLASLGDMTSPSSESVVAMDGIAVITHPNTKLEALTMPQLEDIFSGKATNWATLGGKDMPIHVMSRDDESGTHDAFASLVMSGAPIAAEKVFADNAALASAVESTEGAIGYVGLPYIGQTKALAVDGGGSQVLLPTPFTVATEDYPLARRLFFYTPESPKDPLTRKLVDFALSDDGQALVSDAGFVPLSLRAGSSTVGKGAPTEYKKLAAGATRLSVDFRFRSGGSELDTKAKHDLDRLVRYLSATTNRGRKLALAGFADGQGNAQSNLTLSKQRAEAIAKLLETRGVTAEVASFGSALPVAPNTSESGRARNRRVEVWLR